LALVPGRAASVADHQRTRDSGQRTAKGEKPVA
jgi:hypothetical protein